MNLNIKKSILAFIFILAIFVSAVFVWYSPVLFKGYAPYQISSGISVARNMSEAGFFSLESDLNVVLSSSLVSEKGQATGITNSQLTPYFYSGIWSLFGPFSANQLIFLDIIIEALVLVLFAILVADLFGRKVSLFFALIYIFLPFNWQMAYEVASYEVALLFVALFFIFYFQAQKDYFRKYSRFFLILSGIFLAGAIFAKEAFILLPPFLILFLLWKKRKEALLFIMIPLFLLMGVFWLPNFVKNSNLNLLPGIDKEQSQSADFSFYAHLYPDPYTYHFNKEEFLEEKFKNYDKSGVSIAKIENSKVMKNVGVKGVSFLERIKVSLVIGSRHFFRFVSLEEVGGPFVFLLLFLGLYYLKRNNWELGRFFIGWIVFSVLIMSLILLLSRSHLMDFNWAIALMITLGVLTLSQMIFGYFGVKENKLIWIQLFVLMILLYNFVLANHVVFGDLYDKTKVPKLEAYSQEIKSFNIKDEEVIALDMHGSNMYQLNYLSDKSLVMFRKNTIEKLIKENKLNEAFDKFNVKYVLGYSDDFTEKIVKSSDVKNIATSSLKPMKYSISRNKGWLMNLVK